MRGAGEHGNEQNQNHKFLLMAMHERDWKVGAVTEYAKSHMKAFHLTVRVSDEERIEVGKFVFLEQNVTPSGTRFFKSEGRGKKSRGHNHTS